MDIQSVLTELHRELARIEEAIQTLERLQKGTPRRGRPPGWLTLVTQGAQGENPQPAKKPRKKAEDKSA
jgi:hypothetical protein